MWHCSFFGPGQLLKTLRYSPTMVDVSIANETSPEANWNRRAGGQTDRLTYVQGGCASKKQDNFNSVKTYYHCIAFDFTFRSEQKQRSRTKLVGPNICMKNIARKNVIGTFGTCQIWFQKLSPEFLSKSSQQF